MKGVHERTGVPVVATGNEVMDSVFMSKNNSDMHIAGSAEEPLAPMYCVNCSIDRLDPGYVLPRSAVQMEDHMGLHHVRGHLIHMRGSRNIRLLARVYAAAMTTLNSSQED